MRWREASARIGLVALGVLVGSMLFELGGNRLLRSYACDSELGWAPPPGRTVFALSREFAHPVHVNALGLVDREREVPKPSGHWRAVVLGDSMVASLQVPREQRFTDRLERRLAGRAAPGRRVEVVNAGVGGWGTAQELLFLRGRGAALEPDLVALAFFAANDVANNTPTLGSWLDVQARRCGRPYLVPTPGPDAAQLVPFEAMPVSLPAGDRLLRHSMLYPWFLAAVPPPRPRPAFLRWGPYRTHPVPAAESAWALTQQLVLAVRDEAVAQGARFVVLLVPSRRELGQQPSAADRARRWDWSKPRRRMAAFLASEGVASVDLAPALRARIEAGERPYFARDPHWNELGHEVVGASLEAAWTERCADLGVPIAGCGDGAAAPSAGVAATSSSSRGTPRCCRWP